MLTCEVFRLVNMYTFYNCSSHIGLQVYNGCYILVMNLLQSVDVNRAFKRVRACGCVFVGVWVGGWVGGRGYTYLRNGFRLMGVLGLGVVLFVPE